MSSSLDYSVIGMPDMQSVEQTLNMSPMDLFDSIFWGEYNFTDSGYELKPEIEYPAAGLDQVGYDYAQQQLYTQY